MQTLDLFFSGVLGNIFYYSEGHSLFTFVIFCLFIALNIGIVFQGYLFVNSYKLMKFHEGHTELNLDTSEGYLGETDYFEITDKFSTFTESYIKGQFKGKTYVIKLDRPLFNHIVENEISKLYGNVVNKKFYAIKEN